MLRIKSLTCMLNRSSSWKLIRKPVIPPLRSCPTIYQPATRAGSPRLAQDISRAHVSKCFSSNTVQKVEDIYEKKTPIEHVLLRPGMYIGSVEESEQHMWLIGNDSAPPHLASHFARKTARYNPGLYKIFDEILVNAIDNHARDKSTTRIDVVLPVAGSKTATFSVRNNGRGIPVQLHKKEGVYVPEMVLGQLLTGSNFADAKAGAEAQYTGGRHGYGAKLTNIFSKEFSVETVDTKESLRYSQTWNNNMTIRHEPTIASVNSGKKGRDNEDFTMITFVPDLERFGMETLSSDMVAILTKRVWEVAGCNPQVAVYLQGKRLKIASAKSYVRMFVPNVPDDQLKFYSRGDKWNIAVTSATKATNGLNTVSFVNNTSTSRGGTHVNYIIDQIAKAVASHINNNKRKFGGVVATPALVRPHIFLFLNCKIANPSFDSQTKELLTTKASDFGSTCLLPVRFLREIFSTSGIVEAVVDRLKMRDQAALIRSTSRTSSKASLLLDIPKLEDANLAGAPKKSQRKATVKKPLSNRQCSLILTEGDSAKALAVAGLSVVGRDYYGVYPLRGKPLNARDAPIKQILANKELQDLVSALGLDFTKTYESEQDRDTLRYGQVIIMADQDPDGSHIKGLVINFFHHFFPELLKNGFLSQFITPLIKAKPPRGHEEKNELQFFSIRDYQDWQRQLGINSNRWKIKYYKGLGTSTSEEARDYFSDLKRHLIPFHWNSDDDGDFIDMAFNKTRVQHRKDWLLTYGKKAASRMSGIETANAGSHKSEKETQPPCSHHKSPQLVSFSEFINEELVQFSLVDLHRSIPSVVDGLKPSQRKVLFSCFKRRLTKEMKVAQLSGYCSEHAGYHHGEMSLHSTIVGMAQDFVGSNNLPLLEGVGQFGTRLQGGKDAASARYIFTKLSPIARVLFPVEDDSVLNWLNDDGHPVEPLFYVPLIPLVLVNGAKGIGTGWSTDIPCHNPDDIIDLLLAKLGSGTISDVNHSLLPWFSGYEGSIDMLHKDSLDTSMERYYSRGCVEQLNTTDVLISELPVGVWTQSYKEWLLKAARSGAITSFKEEHTENSVAFRVKMSRAGLRHALNHGSDKSNKKKVHQGSSGLESFFQLSSSHSMNNMHLFQPDGATVKRYTSAKEVIDDFMPVRLDTYERRKAAQVKVLKEQANILDNKARFIDDIVGGSIDLKWSSGDLESHLLNEGFHGKTKLLSAPTTNTTDNDGNDSKDFRYLLEMPLTSLSSDRVSALKEQGEKVKMELEALGAMSIEHIWIDELKELKNAIATDRVRRYKKGKKIKQATKKKRVTSKRQKQ